MLTIIFLNAQYVLANTNASRPMFLLWGDSITEFSVDPRRLGFQTILELSYNRKADVLNRGCSGYNTKDAMAITPSLMAEFKSHPPALVTIFFGANDACYPSSPIHVDLKSYKSNLELMIQNVQRHWAKTKILLITPPPVDDSRVKDRENSVTSTYAKTCVDVAKEFHLPVLDTWTKMSAIPKWPNLLRDGLHFNTKGNVVFHSMVLYEIKANFPELSVESIQKQFPH